MMLALLTRRLTPFSSTIPTVVTPSITSGYATATSTKSKSAGGGRKRPVLTPQQMKDEAIRKLLYPRLVGKPRLTPIGLHRREVDRALKRVVRSAEAHETIERAWQLHRRQLRQTRSEALRVQYESMKNAMEKLKELDPALYDVARQRVDPRGMSAEDTEELKTLKGPARKFFLSRIQGLFPREMWIPTDTPKKDGWNYEWVPPRNSTASHT